MLACLACLACSHPPPHALLIQRTSCYWSVLASHCAEAHASLRSFILLYVSRACAYSSFRRDVAVPASSEPQDAISCLPASLLPLSPVPSSASAVAAFSTMQCRWVHRPRGSTCPPSRLPDSLVEPEVTHRLPIPSIPSRPWCHCGDITVETDHESRSAYFPLLTRFPLPDGEISACPGNERRAT